jgi:hypothetical protein
VRICASAGIRLLCLGAALTLVACAFAQQAPWGRPNIPISPHDRVYAADQTSNTVSVIDPSSKLVHSHRCHEGNLLLLLVTWPTDSARNAIS